MRIPFNWLKEYVNADIPVKDLSEKLTMSGMENEILKADKGSFPDIVVGEILKIEKHPNADKLQVTKTDIGGTTLKIICGAPNIEVGQKVPVAEVGAELGEFEIKEVEIRGVKSYGMICSEAELGISNDHTGIMVLNPRAKVGSNLTSALNIGEIVLEAEITPNRGDCLSMIGVAREAAVVSGKRIKLPETKVREIEEKTSSLVKVEIKDKKLCSRYIARVIRNVKIGPSPKWMQDRLSASGVRPINNIVDVTNYVMLETGQPLHVFDADKIVKEKEWSKIIVRSAKRGERITTLDGVDRQLESSDIVIADNEKAVALAGVMGGANSEVTKSTKTIILESANFHPTSVRRTALKLALRSESSLRFEKGLPVITTEEAANRAAFFLADIAGGEVLAGKVDAGVKKDKIRKVSLDFKRIKSFLGEDISSGKAVSILESLGFKTINKHKDKAQFVIPYWRLDISIEEDLLEEIARIYGYNKIPSTLPEGVLPEHERNKKIEISRKIREILTALGFFEVYSYSFTNREKANVGKGDIKLVKIANPLSQDHEYMRADLLGSLMDIVSKNKDIVDDIKIYEVASVYKSREEEQKISILTTGRDEDDAFSTVAGAMAAVFSNFNIKNICYKNNKEENSGIVYSDNKKLGSFVVLDSAETAVYKVKSKSVCFIELDIGVLGKLTTPKKFSAISKFPRSLRDLTFVFDEEIRVDEIKKIIEGKSSKILDKIEVVDIYRGKGLPCGKKSISIRFYYQSWERTLEDKEVDDDQKNIIKRVESLGGKLRDGDTKK